MRDHLITAAIAAGLLVGTGPVFADHNSKNGEGWANMPNDIHNTRIETRDSDDNEAFREFVKFGEGSRTVNRFDTDDTRSDQPNDRNDGEKSSPNADKAAPKKRNEIATHNATRNKNRADARTRLETQTSAGTRLNRSTASMRGIGGRRGNRR